MFSNFFPEDRVVYEITRVDMVQPGKATSQNYTAHAHWTMDTLRIQTHTLNT